MSDQPRREKPVSRHSRRRGTDNSDSTDFDKLSRCAEHEIHEGTVLFAGRIVEKELELALQAHRLPPSGNLYGNILRLRFMGLAPTAVIDAANALRLASNAIRHAQRDAQAGDGDLAIALIRIVLDWRKMAASGLPKARHAPVQAFVDALMGVPLEPRRLLDH